MDIKVSRPSIESELTDKEEIERVAAHEVLASIDFFSSSPISIGDEGLYLRTGNKIHILTIDIKYVKTIERG
jgi:hypothetical protein